jgi:hypothetical protein
MGFAEQPLVDVINGLLRIHYLVHYVGDALADNDLRMAQVEQLAQ